MSIDPQGWNNAIAALPGAHILQTWEWSQVKAPYGWQPVPRLWHNASGQVCAAAMILARQVRLPLPGAAFRVLYIPRGPLLDWTDAGLRRLVLDDLSTLGREQGAIFLKIDPEVILGRGIPGQATAVEEPSGLEVRSDLLNRGWRFSPDQVQFRNTVWINLSLQPDQLLAQMKQKTRYNLRLAQRKGVTVRSGTEADLPMLYHMYAETSARDGFVIREQPYYLAVWSTFMRAAMADCLIAEVDGEPAAALLMFHFGGKAWYLYGMSRQAHREKMPNYLLQWHAIELARQLGCQVYDLWGAPDEFNESDALWGVYRFKEGLGGEVIRTLGAWDLPLRPMFYRLYTQVLPRWLDILRRRGQERTRRLIS